MKPLINSPGPCRGTGVAAGAAEDRAGRADRLAAAARPGSYFLRGKAVFIVQFGRCRRLVPGRADLAGQGQLRRRRCCPARSRYWDHGAQGLGRDATTRNRVGNTTGGSWHGVILRDRRNQEAAYSFLSLMAIKPVSIWAVAAWLDRRSTRLQLPDAAARRRGAARRLRQGRLGPGRRQGLSPGLSGDLQRPDDAALPAHPRHARILVRARQRAGRGAGRPQDARRRRSTTPPPPGSRSPTGSAATSSWKPTGRPSATTRAKSPDSMRVPARSDRPGRPCRRVSPPAAGPRPFSKRPSWSHPRPWPAFPAPDDIPADQLLPEQVHQRGWLIDGELRQWPGPFQPVLSAVCVRGPDGSAGPGRARQSSRRAARPRAMAALDAAVAAYDNGRGEWPTMAVAERIACMQEFATPDGGRSREQIVKLIMWEIGKSLADSREGVRPHRRLHPGHHRGAEGARQRQLALRRSSRARSARSAARRSAWCCAWGRTTTR